MRRVDKGKILANVATCSVEPNSLQALVGIYEDQSTILLTAESSYK